jgi:hypothetical protein
VAAELRPRAIRNSAMRATRLSSSRALLKAAIEELYPDALVAEIVGNSIASGAGAGPKPSPSRLRVATVGDATD